MRRFPVILADPPWSFGNQSNRASPAFGGKGRELPVYNVMPIEDIVAMGPAVQKTALDDSFLFLWAPNSFVLDGQAMDVCKAWGFTPKQLIPWIKLKLDGGPSMGMGNYTRVCSEQLILARRGKATVATNRRPLGIIQALRGKHSAKPDESYQMIEKMCDGPYLELFARRRWSDKWTVLGDQAPKDE